MAELLPIANSTEAKPSETEELHADRLEAYERGKTDLNFFAGLMIPDMMEYDFPEFYVGCFNLLTKRPEKYLKRILRFALGLPRGHAKTTFIKILICWLIAYDKVTFVAVICATDELAESLIGDVNDMLCSDNFTKIYGHWKRQLLEDNKGTKISYFHERSVIIKARGAEGSIRGINVKNRRPDLIFCDDAQTKECDDSPTERLKFRKWLVAMFKIIAPKGDRWIIYVGNMYSEECILYQLKENPAWISMITGAIKADGTPLWPELHSLEELMESYFHDEALGEADVWFAEVMNDPVSRVTSLLSEAILESPYDKEPYEPDGVFITIDPAGFKDVSDDNVIALHHVYNGEGIVHEIDAGIKDPEQLIMRALEMALNSGASVIGIEDVAYQQTLIFWVEKYMRELKIHGIEVVPLKPHGKSKEARIRLFIAELLNRSYHLSNQVRAAFIWQALKYKLGAKKNKDDILDCCAYALQIRNEYWALVRNLKTVQRNSNPSLIYFNNTPF